MGFEREEGIHVVLYAHCAQWFLYFQVNYTEENLLGCIDLNNDKLMIRLANGRLLAECCTMLGIDKRATIITNWSEFHRRANIREGDVCAFCFRSLQSTAWFSPCIASRCTIEDTAALCQYNLALSTQNYAVFRGNLWFAFGSSYRMLFKTLNLCGCLCKVHYS